MVVGGCYQAVAVIATSRCWCSQEAAAPVASVPLGQRLLVMVESLQEVEAGAGEATPVDPAQPCGSQTDSAILGQVGLRALRGAPYREVRVPVSSWKQRSLQVIHVNPV